MDYLNYEANSKMKNINNCLKTDYKQHMGNWSKNIE